MPLQAIPEVMSFTYHSLLRDVPKLTIKPLANTADSRSLLGLVYSAYFYHSTTTANNPILANPTTFLNYSYPSPVVCTIDVLLIQTPLGNELPLPSYFVITIRLLLVNTLMLQSCLNFLFHLNSGLSFQFR